MIQSFTIEEKTGPKKISIDLKGAILCGYTGRNQGAVKKHIEELAKEGVKPPPSVPTFFPKPAWGVTVDGDIYVESLESSGEIEFVLFVDKHNIWVGLGSDHTDREMERLDILKSKQPCPTPVAQNLWNYEEVKGHWDQIEMRSWVSQKGKRFLYQETTLATILPPEELIRLVKQKVQGSVEGIAIYSGTSPITTERMVCGDRFEGELFDPVLKRKITLNYSIHTLDSFKR